MTFLCCQVCQAEIVCPDNVVIGEKLVVKTSDQADIYLWQIPDAIQFEALPGNTELHCWGKVGKYKFGLVTLKIDWEAHKVIQGPQQYKELTITEGSTPPVPLTGFAKEVYDWGMAVPINRECATPISKNYSTVADKYNKMELTVQQAFDELRKLNNAVLDTREEKDSWAVFGSRLEEKLNSVWPMDKAATVRFLQDVALGLSHVK